MESIELDLWSAFRGMEEGQLLLEHLARHTHHEGQGRVADLLGAKAQVVAQRADVLRQVAVDHGHLSAEMLGPRPVPKTTA
jgi:hypothetical protein